MPTLYLLRHSHADSHGGEGADHGRVLTAHGERVARAIGEQLAAHAPTPEAVWVSSARRALETWAQVAGVLSAAFAGSEGAAEPGEVVVSDRLYLATPSAMLELLHEQQASLASGLLVGHNPGIHDLAMALAGEGDADAYDRLRSDYPPAGLCSLEFDGAWPELAPGRARLARFDVPAE